jgi:hypothetical protein
MASSESKIRGGRWRLLVGSVTLGATALGLTGVAVAATSTEPSDGPPSSTAVVECTSGTVTQGDVQMSALVVERAPGGEHPDFPGGCVQTG